jgi:hypothetical protein
MAHTIPKESTIMSIQCIDIDEDSNNASFGDDGSHNLGSRSFDNDAENNYFNY